MSDYGKRGGTSATAGRKAKTLVDPISGAKVRAFGGQAWLCFVQQHEGARPLISVHATEAEARERMGRLSCAMERDLADWRRKDGERHIWRALPTEPPHGRPDVEYVVRAA